MHLSDNVLPAPVWIGGLAAAGAGLALSLRRMTEEDAIRSAILASFFFVASSFSVPLPWGSVHLVLAGLIGIVLGWRALPAFLVALIFQLVILGYGGLSTLGINTFNLTLGAWTARGIYRARRPLGLGHSPTAAGAIAGGLGTLTSALALFLCLLTAGEELHLSARVALVAHLPVVLVESVVTGFAVRFLTRVRPSLLPGKTSART